MRIQGVITEDVYAVRGTVDVLATIEGDVVVAGGRVTVGERTGGDAMAAGGDDGQYSRIQLAAGNDHGLCRRRFVDID